MENKKTYSMEELYGMDYSDLVQLWDEKVITSLQFVESLPNDYFSDWKEWLQDENRERNEQSANDYLDWCDEIVEDYEPSLEEMLEWEKSKKE